MAKPFQAVESAVSHAFHPITSAISRAFTLPGLSSGAGQQAAAQPPQPAPPAQTPSGAPDAKNLASTQLSFLTAASKAAAAIGTGGSSGKSLLGS